MSVRQTYPLITVGTPRHHPTLPTHDHTTNPVRTEIQRRPSTPMPTSNWANKCTDLEMRTSRSGNRETLHTSRIDGPPCVSTKVMYDVRPTSRAGCLTSWSKSSPPTKRSFTSSVLGGDLGPVDLRALVGFFLCTVLRQRGIPTCADQGCR